MPRRAPTPKHKPQSTDGPTQLELERDATLGEFMAKGVPLEDKSEIERRETVIGELTRVFREWVREVCRKKGLAEEQAAEAGGKLYTSGSWRLGVHEPGADIDVVCVAPRHCTRVDFFATLKQKMMDHPQVENLKSIETAAVPILTFDFDKVNIDLLFAHMPLNTVPESFDIDDDAALQGVDEKTEKSLNGPRVTNLIIELVPKTAWMSFLATLRCLRVWAKQRAIYSNKLGYLGGVNFNILLAMLCQIFPNKSVSFLLIEFFRLYSKWQWPDPILLCEPHDAGHGFECWSRHSARFNPRGNLMPILTPAYPTMNSAANVAPQTLQVMTDEFKRARNMIAIMTRDGRVPTRDDWADLFRPTDFFVKYNRYLALNIVANSEEDHMQWIGYAASKLRKLVERLASKPLSKIHLLPVEFPHRTVADKPHGACYFVAIEIDKLRVAGSKLMIGVSFTEFYDDELKRMKGFKDGMDLHLQLCTWRELPDFVFEKLGGRLRARKFRRELLSHEKQKRERAAAAVAGDPGEEAKAHEEADDDDAEPESIAAASAAANMPSWVGELDEQPRDELKHMITVAMGTDEGTAAPTADASTELTEKISEKYSVSASQAQEAYEWLLPAPADDGAAADTAATVAVAEADEAAASAAGAAGGAGAAPDVAAFDDEGVPTKKRARPVADEPAAAAELPFLAPTLPEWHPLHTFKPPSFKKFTFRLLQDSELAPFDVSPPITVQAPPPPRPPAPTVVPQQFQPPMVVGQQQMMMGNRQPQIMGPPMGMPMGGHMGRPMGGMGVPPMGGPSPTGPWPLPQAMPGAFAGMPRPR